MDLLEQYKKQHSAIPDFFKSVLWSYDFTRCDAENDRKLLIVQAINYGDLRHWRWIAERYSRDAVRATLQEIPANTLRPRVRRLAALIFDIEKYNDAPRRA